MKCLNLILSLTSCMIVTMKTQYHPVPVRARTRPPSTTVKRSNCSGSQLCYHRINEAPCQVYKQAASKNTTQVLASTCSSLMSVVAMHVSACRIMGSRPRSPAELRVSWTLGRGTPQELMSSCCTVSSMRLDQVDSMAPHRAHQRGDDTLEAP